MTSPDEPPTRDPSAAGVAEAVGELLTGTGQVDPYPIYERIRAAGPLARVQERFFVATGYEVILRDPAMRVGDADLARFHGGSGIDPDSDPVGTSLLRTNPPDHTRLRRLVAGAFTARRVLRGYAELPVTLAPR
jgi:cytochrome P450